jgi:hypothetical protein
MQIRLSKVEVRAINHHHLPLSRQALSFYGRVLMNGKKFSRYYVAYLQKGDSHYAPLDFVKRCARWSNTTYRRIYQGLLANHQIQKHFLRNSNLDKSVICNNINAPYI